MTSPAEMTQAECGEVLRYQRGAQFSGAARRMLGEFFDKRGWDVETTQEEVFKVAQERRDARSPIAKMCDSPVYCEVCGDGGAGVTDDGWRCEKHWASTGEPLFDWATGFSLTS